jgi:hypothetical protein
VAAIPKFRGDLRKTLVELPGIEPDAKNALTCGNVEFDERC